MVKGDHQLCNSYPRAKARLLFSGIYFSFLQELCWLWTYFAALFPLF